MWWHVYPLGFTGAPVRPASESERALTHRLRHLEAWLDHVVGLGLNGLLLGPIFASDTHGYDTVDYFRIDPRLGDDADLDRLVAACHARGVRLVLDGVFNHVSRAHPAAHDLSQQGEVFEGHESLVVLDHSSPAIADLVTEVMLHWLDRGIDGWRLDAAYALPPAFWQRVLPRVREQYPDAWFLGEVIHGDYPAIVAASGMDTVTQYELWQGIWHGISDHNFFETVHALQRHDEMLASFVPATFVGNHDVTRIASAVGHDLVPHALAVLLTVAGTPSIYAGDELGMTGVKEERLGGDDAVRPMFPAEPPSPEALGDDPVWRAHRELVGVRRRHPWLRTARTDVVHVANGSLVLRTGTGDGAIVTVLNIDGERVTLPAADATAVLAGAADLDDGERAVTLPAHGWAVLGTGAG
ncbi:alpha-amylase family glycosyl hydrolase [Georgenia halophila]